MKIQAPLSYLNHCIKKKLTLYLREGLGVSYEDVIAITTHH